MNRYVLIFCLTFFVALAVMPHYIKFLKSLNFHQEVSDYSLKQFVEKAKTPIMGGVIFIMIPIIFSVLFLLGNNITKKEILVLAAFFGFGFVGFLDDFLIIKRKNNNGLKPKYKLLGQLILVIIFSFFLKDLIDFHIHIPFTQINVDLGYFYYVFLIIMFLGESNATNFTDGMDGLLAGCSIIVLIVFGIYCINAKEYNILLIIISIIAGLLSYLRFNFFPAKIFMGDSGSLALGGLFSMLSVILKKELALVIIGGTFFWELMSVVLQILAVKTIKRRIFLYTPIHYSFVKRGWKEKNVVLFMWAITILLAFIGYFVGLY